MCRAVVRHFPRPTRGRAAERISARVRDVRRSAQLRDTANSVRVSRLQLVTGHADLNTSTPQHPVDFPNLDFDTFVPMSCGNNLFKCLFKALMDS